MFLKRDSIKSIELRDVVLCQRHSHKSPQSFYLPMNEVVQISGQKGVGKSDLLEIIAYIKAPHRGKYLVNNLEVFDMSFEDTLSLRLNTGYSFEYGGLINKFTIYENLKLPLSYHKFLSNDELEERIDFYLNLFNLQKVKDLRPAFVSGSIRKEVCILRSLVMQPEMLILDNPTAGMSADNIGKLKKYLIHNKKKVEPFKHIFIVSENKSFLSGLVTEELNLNYKQVHKAA